MAFGSKNGSSKGKHSKGKRSSRQGASPESSGLEAEAFSQSRFVPQGGGSYQDLDSSLDFGISDDFLSKSAEAPSTDGVSQSHVAQGAADWEGLEAQEESIAAGELGSDDDFGAAEEPVASEGLGAEEGFDAGKGFESGGGFAGAPEYGAPSDYAYSQGYSFSQDAEGAYAVDGQGYEGSSDDGDALYGTADDYVGAAQGRAASPQDYTAQQDYAAQQSYQSYQPHQNYEGDGSYQAAAAGHAAGSDYSRDSSRYKARKRGMSVGKKIAIGVTSVLVVAVVAVGVAAALVYNGILTVPGTDFSRDDITNVVEAEADEPYYVLVLGSDSRTEDGEGSRSDSMIVARIDEQEQTVSLLSIPRDLYVYMDEHGYQKINAATAYGGYDYAISVVNELLDIQINYYVFVYFSGFEDLVDELGGVTVEVPEGTYYKGTWVTAGDAVEIDGKEALVLARCRKGYPEGEGAYAKGDYQRTINQRNLIKAICEKVLETDTSDLPGLVKSLKECVDTNMDVDRIVSLATNMQGMDVDTIDSAQVPVAGANDGEAWVACMYEDVFQVMLDNFVSGKKLMAGCDGFDEDFVNAEVGDDYVEGELYWYTYYEDKYGDFTVDPDADEDDGGDGGDDGEKDDGEDEDE